MKEIDNYINITDDEYRDLYYQYMETEHTPFICFEEWLGKENYRFRVKDILFDSFKEMWEYLINCMEKNKEDIGYHICKKI